MRYSQTMEFPFRERHISLQTLFHLSKQSSRDFSPWIFLLQNSLKLKIHLEVIEVESIFHRSRAITQIHECVSIKGRKGSLHFWELTKPAGLTLLRKSNQKEGNSTQNHIWLVQGLIESSVEGFYMNTGGTENENHRLCPQANSSNC